MVKSFQQHYSSYRLILLYKVWREIPNWLATSDKFPLYLSIAFLIMLYSISSKVVASFVTGFFFARGKSKSLPSNTLLSAMMTAFSIVLRLFQLISADFLRLHDVFRNYSALSVGFLVRDRMAAFTGTYCGHGMEKTCAGLLMDSTQCPSASRNPPAGTV